MNKKELMEQLHQFIEEFPEDDEEYRVVSSFVDFVDKNLVENKITLPIIIKDLLLETFEDDYSKARLWLNQPLFGIHSKTPLDLIKTEEGVELVEQTLHLMMAQKG